MHRSAAVWGMECGVWDCGMEWSMDGVCVVYKAGFVGFLVAGCDCRFYDPHSGAKAGLAWLASGWKD